jgi:hypothetical protein
MPLGDITTDTMRTAFAQYAKTHEAATIQRCWSTWNVLCTLLYTSELIVANPMPLVGRPNRAKTLPKALPTDSVAALLGTLNAAPERRRSHWVERDRALISLPLELHPQPTRHPRDYQRFNLESTGKPALSGDFLELFSGIGHPALLEQQLLPNLVPDPP